MATPARQRLPNRRLAVTEPIEFLRSDGTPAIYEATIGFDARGAPKKVFLFGERP